MATSKKKSKKAKGSQSKKSKFAKKSKPKMKKAAKKSKAVKAKPATKTGKTKPAKKAAKPVQASKPAKQNQKASSTNTKKISNFSWDNFFTPLDDRLVVLVEGPSEKTAGGLYIPAMVSERPNQGEVLIAGRGKKDKKGRIRPMDVKAGEKVLFGTYAGMKMILHNQEVLMLREEDIMGVID